MITYRPKYQLIGLHSDDKHRFDGFDNGTRFIEMDTGHVYYYDNENNRWLTNDVKPVSLTVDTPPTTVEYTAGDLLDLTGLVVEVEYNNGDTETVTDYTTSPEAGDALTTTDTSVTISYIFNGVTVTAEQAITVNESP